MEKITCEVVADLLALYCDEVCSQDSRRLVEGHLKGCPDCQRMLQNMRAGGSVCGEGQHGEKIIKGMAATWKRSVLKSFFKGLGAAACLVLLLVAGYWGLVRWPTVAIAPDAIKASADVSDGEFMVRVETTNGYKAVSMDLTATEDGKLYIVFLRGVVPVKNGAGTNAKGIYSGPLDWEQEEGGTIRIREIYYGTKNDAVRLWKE